MLVRTVLNFVPPASLNSQQHRAFHHALRLRPRKQDIAI
jgi:hypothetical protein